MAEQILPDDLRYVYSPEELAEITELADTTIIEVTTPSTAIPLKTTVAELKEFILSGGTGSGDMLASTYDPTNVAGDAFDMDNMNEGTTNKLVSATEKSNWDAKLDYLPVTFSYSGETLTSTKTVAEILAAITANKQIIAYHSGIAGFLTENIIFGIDLVAFTFLYDSATITITGDGSGETDSWTLLEENIEKTSNKVSEWSVTPNDTNYPTEKLVKDSLDDKQDALTFGIANTNAVKIDEASVSDNDYAKFTANGLEGRTYAEVLSDIGGQAALGFTPENVANKETSALDTSTSKYPCNNVVNTALGTKVTANAGITAATKTKITYDAKGLVTGGADATTADIADSTNKRYCTDAEKTVISNTSNTNTGDQDATDFDIKDLTDSTSLRSTWSGKQDALTFGIANTNALKVDDASAADNEYARFTANGLEGRSAAEVLSDIGGQASLGFTPENTANKETSALDTSTTKYPCNNVVKSAVDEKVTANSAITGATKTKVTYDAKGLVTGGADATTADIADSTNKRYCTDAEKTVIGNTSNTNTGDQEATDFDIKDLTDSTNLRSTWSGKQNALTFGIANTNALKVDDASAADNEYAKFTANGIKGRTYAEVKQDLDLEVGTDVQAYDAGLADIAGLAVTDGNIIVGNGTNWVAESGSTARTSLGLAIGTDVAAQTHATQHAVGGADSVFPVDPNADKYLKFNNTSNAIEWADVATPQLVYPLSDGAYSGFTLAGTLYETVAFGESVYFDGTKWRKLSCLVTLIDYRAGICVQAGNANAATTILLYGTIRADSLYDFTVGNRIYSGYAAGQILSHVSTTVQNTANVIPYILGTALDANTAFIKPQFVEAQKMTGGSETSDPSTIANFTRNNQYIIKFEAAGTTRSIAIAQTTECPITHLDLQNTTGSDITVTFTPPSGKTIIKNYDSLVVSAGGHKLIRYWLVGTLLYIVDEDMTAGGTNSDEKVKYDASDPTAGYIADKFIAGTGISLAEGTGANENKLVITNSSAGSGGLSYFTLTYYQATPVTCSTGETCFDTRDGKIYTATATNTWDSGVTASTSVIYKWKGKSYQYISGTELVRLDNLSPNVVVLSDTSGTAISAISSYSVNTKLFCQLNNTATTRAITISAPTNDACCELTFENNTASAITITFPNASGIVNYPYSTSGIIISAGLRRTISWEMTGEASSTDMNIFWGDEQTAVS